MHTPRTISGSLLACALSTASIWCLPAQGSTADVQGPIVNPVGPIELDAPPPSPASLPDESLIETRPDRVPPSSDSEAAAITDPANQPVDAFATNLPAPPVDTVSPSSEEREASRVSVDRPIPPQEASPLGAPTQTKTLGSSPGAGADAIPGKSGWVRQTGAALGVVLGLILLGRYGLVALARRSGGLSAMLGAGGRAPSGVMEILARYPVSRGHTLVLLKVDRRVLVLCHTSAGFTTLTEFIEPEEVASILMRVRDEEGESMAARFSEMLHELADQPMDEGEPVSPRMAMARDAERDHQRWPSLRSVSGGDGVNIGGGAS